VILSLFKAWKDDPELRDFYFDYSVSFLELRTVGRRKKVPQQSFICW
jgi:hypothetical protein